MLFSKNSKLLINEIYNDFALITPWKATRITLSLEDLENNCEIYKNGNRHEEDI